MKKTKRWGALLLTVCMLAGLLPLSAAAVDVPEQQEESITLQAGGTAVCAPAVESGESVVWSVYDESVAGLYYHNTANRNEITVVGRKAFGTTLVTGAVYDEVGQLTALYRYNVSVTYKDYGTTQRDIYLTIDQVEHCRVYYSEGGALHEIAAGRVINKQVTGAYGIAFFAAAEEGYVLSGMTAANSSGNYDALSDGDPYNGSGSTFDKKSGNLVGAGEWTQGQRYAVMSDALLRGCDGGQLFTRPRGSSAGVSTTLSFYAEKLPTLELKVVSILRDGQLIPYSGTETVRAGDTVNYELRIHFYPRPYKNSVTYTDIQVRDTLTGTTHQLPDYVSSDAAVTKVLEGSFTITAANAEELAGKDLTESATLSFTYRSDFSHRSFTGEVSDSDSVLVEAAVRYEYISAHPEMALPVELKNRAPVGTYQAVHGEYVTADVPAEERVYIDLDNHGVWTLQNSWSVQSSGQTVPMGGSYTMSGTDTVFQGSWNFEKTPYTVTFLKEDGSLLRESTYYYDDVVSLPEAPAKPADNEYTYVFAGWGLISGTRLGEGSRCQGNVTYQALYKYSQIGYTIRFYNDDQTLLYEVPYHYGDEISVPEGPERPDSESYSYRFDGWYNDKDQRLGEGTLCTGNVEYTARYQQTERSYTVRFCGEDGTLLQEYTGCRYGEMIQIPEALQKESDDQYHYQWAGWTLVEGTALGEDGSCRGDAVYRAYFTSALRSHTVAFYNYDGQLLTQGDYVYDAEVSPEDPSRESDLRYTYAFSHWQAYADAALETPLEGVTLPAGGTLTVRKAAYFKAVYQPTLIEYTVRWLDRHGQEIYSENVYGGDLMPQAPAEGYELSWQEEGNIHTFQGWEIVDGNAPFNGKCNGSVTYQTAYDAVQEVYSVIFWDEERQTVYSDKEYHYGDPLEVPEDPERPSDIRNTYQFIGWSPELEYSVTGSKFYTAQFQATPRSYSIRYFAEDGETLLTENSCHYGDAILFPEETPEKEESAFYTYRFVGWEWVAGSEPQEENGQQSCTGSADFKAVYAAVPKMFTVTFLDQNGQTLESRLISYGYLVEMPAVPPLAHYENGNWTLASGSALRFENGMYYCQGDVSYQAEYTPVSYTVVFYDEDGSVPLASFRRLFGESVVLPEGPDSKPSADPEQYYEFSHWELVQGTPLTKESDGTWLCAGNVAYRVRYRTMTRLYYVTFYDMGSEEGNLPVISSERYAKGDVVTWPADPVRSGYVFSGWKLIGGTAVAQDRRCQGAVTYRAVYTPVEDIVTPVRPAPPAPQPDKDETPDVPEELNGADHIAYIKGFEDGMVRPENHITRAETATMLYRLLTQQRREQVFTTENSFSDVTTDLWYNKAVSSMAKGGYLKGYADGTFGGGRPITRAEFVAILARFTNEQGDGCSFSDVTERHWAYTSIVTAAAKGWIDGYADGSFGPDRYITRAEAATIINRVLCRGVQEAGVSSGFHIFPDCSVEKWYYWEIVEAANGHTYTGQRPEEDWTGLALNDTYDIVKYENP